MANSCFEMKTRRQANAGHQADVLAVFSKDQEKAGGARGCATAQANSGRDAW